MNELFWCIHCVRTFDVRLHFLRRPKEDFNEANKTQCHFQLPSLFFVCFWLSSTQRVKSDSEITSLRRVFSQSVCEDWDWNKPVVQKKRHSDSCSRKDTGTAVADWVASLFSAYKQAVSFSSSGLINWLMKWALTVHPMTIKAPRKVDTTAT